MNKSIYEEAKETLYILKSIESVDEDGTPNGDSLSDCVEFDVIEKALEQAQKQEHLLELYRKLDDCIVAPTGHHVCRYTDDEKYARIRKQIKELEK